MSCSRIHEQLCRDDLGSVAAAIRAGGNVVIACSEETARFWELAAELDATERVTVVDIRDRAGWSDDRRTGPKMAALIADARIPPPIVPALDISSAGICLVYGDAETVIPAAARLAPVLTVTAMLTSPEEVLIPSGAEMDVVAGQITRATGAIGSFSVEVDRFSERLPSGRAQRFSRPRDGGKSACDIIVDLSGGTPFFPAHHKRDGYLRADPRDPLAVERVLFDAAQLVGSFEKPFYIRMEPSLCAHSRAQQEGCTRCLDVCPTSAISPAGDWVEIDPLVCAGCGACAAVCPTGAASTDDPPVQHLFNRMRTMAEIYARAGGKAPRLLVHDEHGAEMIRLAARYGRGLPADVIPLEISALNGFG
ncbi:MAG TPA: 4Fe-4S dicluster domain-containing protein, partial [Paracoccaceae bacterium]|nr:4Fe-4S dicluster domain-containing protein [Paracoccaceae bacterium]